MAPTSNNISFSLTRKIRVSAWRVAVPVAFGERRPELLSVVQLAVDRGVIDAAIVRDMLFSTLRELVSVRILESAVALGLLERTDAGYRASADGVHALTDGSVLVPQLGQWTLWLTDDVLVPPEHRLLRVDPYVEDRKAQKDREDRAAPEGFPAWVVEALARPAVLHFSKGAPLAHVELHDGVRCQPIEVSHDVRLGLGVRLRGEHRGLEVELSGSVNPDRCEAAHQQPVGRGRFSFPHERTDPREVWHGCLGERAGSWDDATLGVAFSELGDETRSSRKMRLSTRPVEHPVLGGFPAVEVDGVPVRPATEADANAWAAWTLERRIHGYVWPEDWARLTGEVAHEFAPHEITFPDRGELARLARGRAGGAPPAFWHLMAPADLALEET